MRVNPNDYQNQFVYQLDYQLQLITSVTVRPSAGILIIINLCLSILLNLGPK